MAEAQVEFRVWGARGSYPTPDAARRVFGGETTCFELRAPGGALFIDAGTGLRRALGDPARGAAPAIDILLSHLHLDHVIGLPALLAERTADRPATLWTAMEESAARAALDTLFAPPFWPVPLLGDGAVRLRALPRDGAAEIQGMTVRAFPLHHPNGCAGFAIAAAGKRIVIAADHEHGAPDADARLRREAEGADLLVYDGAYSEAEYPQRVGWGHSTREEGLRLAQELGVGRLVITHHAPEATDAVLLSAEEEARRAWSDAILAREGLAVVL